MPKKKINILGTEYKIVHYKKHNFQENADGECFIYDKKIKIRKASKMLSDECNEHEKRERYKEVLRHEITHSILFESGMSEYSRDENLVEWIAIKFPKLLELFKKVNAL